MQEVMDKLDHAIRTLQQFKELLEIAIDLNGIAMEYSR
jgi:hypothetical protein